MKNVFLSKSINKWHSFNLIPNNAYFCGLFDAQVQALRPGATRSLRKLRISAIVHNALVPPGGGPVHRGPQRPKANTGPAGPAAQNNIPPPWRGRPHFFCQLERKGEKEEEERR